jgi:biotin carboxyl carrier protein
MNTKDENGEKLLKQEAPMEELEIGSATYSTRLTEKFKNRPFWERKDERKVLAVIPGTIQKLMVSEGDVVEAGTAMLILEAMKMRNEVVAPVSGRIEKVWVKEGDMVPKNHILVEIS